MIQSLSSSPFRPLLSIIAILTASYSTLGHTANQEFKLALQAYQQKNISKLREYQQTMSNDSLGYYPEYFILNQNLEKQPSHAILNYVQRYDGSAMSEKLAADYIEEKAKSGDFSAATPLVSYVRNPDLSERCAIGLVQNKSTAALELISLPHIFFATDTQPELCNLLASSINYSQIVTPQQKRFRFWGLLRSGLDTAALSSGTAIGLSLNPSQLAEIRTNPKHYILHASKNNDIDYAYLIYAFGRLTKNDLHTAVQYVQTIAPQTPPEVRQYLYRTVAYIGGTSISVHNFNIEVLHLFKQSEGFYFTPEEAIIFARQSIRFSDWQSLIRAIQHMPKEVQQEDTWQYWLARAYEKTGNSRYQHIYKTLATSGDDYHQLWAKARLGYPIQHSFQQPSTQDYQRLSQNIHFQRAFALKQMNAPDTYSNREWNWAVRDAYLKKDDGLLLAAAERANAINWFERGIYAAERTTHRHNHALRFVMPYLEHVVQASAKEGINPAWVYGIMRQESRFIPHAVSPKNAQGLMQIIPDTARSIARTLGEKYHISTIKTPQGAIRYGSHYLARTLKNTGNPVIATAGYNTGPNRAQRWQPKFSAIEADQYTESIPFVETRNYVKHVMTNATHYNLRLGDQNSSILQRMPIVEPRP